MLAKPITTVLFDLDGTVLDTAPDMAAALNQLRIKKGEAPLPFHEIRPYVSRGGSALIEKGFDINESHAEFTTLREEFLELYAQNIFINTVLFEGIEEIIQVLTQNNMNWGIVTNKPGHLTEALLRVMSLPWQVPCVISGDTLPRKKPHPDPLLFACKQLECDTDRTIYVGDAQRDIAAGQAAGMQTVAALYGYIHDEDDPHSWGATINIEHPTELLEYI